MSCNDDLTLLVTAHRENFLAESLLSVIAQTDSEFDLICCADVAVSSDIVLRFEEFMKYVRCRSKRLLIIKGNGTAGRVRNVGFGAASTTWVAYLDGDDYLHPEAIKYVRDAIKNNDEAARVYSTGMVRVQKDGVHAPAVDSLSYYPPRWIYEYDPEKVGHATYFNQFQVISRKAWLEYPYNETSNGEDIDFLLHHLLLGRYLKIPNYLYYFRDTPGSFSKEHFLGGDVCTRRYESGYYRSIFARANLKGLELNFREYRSLGVGNYV